MTAFVIDDGGRAAAGFRGDAEDCVCRSIAIATEIPYADVYAKLTDLKQGWLATSRAAHAKRLAAQGKTTARTGSFRESYAPWLESLGWSWRATMSIGGGCRVHLRADELPTGRLIVRVSRHLVAVIDGVIHDTHDPSRDGTRCVYGLWHK